MNLQFIGIGGAFNNELGCNSSYIKEGNKILFIDFGMDVYDKVIRYNLLDDVENVYIAVTHMHGDHIGGLFTFIDYCYFYKKIVVRILNNSSTFTNKLVSLLDLTGIRSDKFTIISCFELDFDFKLKFLKTSHVESLECYSLMFEKGEKKVLYTSDTNDIDFVVEKVNDTSYSAIYCEVGENSPVHIEYEQLLKLNKDKLVLMHFQSMDLYNRAIKDGFKVPMYLK